MRTFHAPAEFQAGLDQARAEHRTVGLVPTMGALHAGHESLIERAAAECDLVAVTIFVNPLQFGDAGDLERYPRTLEADLDRCRGLGVSVVFAPGVTEMYPEWPEPPATVVAVGTVSEHYEGASRPGHFDGVATVVAKLFALAGRCRAYFGEKDFQQLLVVRRLASDLCLPVDIVGCPTVREHDGLALSSRNARLSTTERAAAVVLSRALREAAVAAASGERRPERLRALMASVVAGEPLVSLDYCAAVDAATLGSPEVLDPGRPARLLIAATVGPVRLIDNAPLVLDAADERHPAPPVLVGARPAT